MVRCGNKGGEGNRVGVYMVRCGNRGVRVRGWGYTW